ncbi:MAG: fatty acid--CoA ligase family protein [Rickettsiales bacterium]|nr:MAG: fatty acid--CoA ligase family protein [Rickettsiales bacterium]
MKIDFLLDSLTNNENKEAVITDTETYTFNDIKKSYIDAKEFLKNNGIFQGSIVSLISDFNLKSIALLIALVENDNIIVPISPTIKTIDKYIQISQTQFVITGDKVEKTGTEITHELLKKVKAGGLILFSSGTTGEPKAALHDLSLLLEKFKKPGKVLKTITFLLFDHIGGFNTLFHALSNGGTIVTISSRDPDVVCKVIEKNKVELLPCSPTFLNLLLLNRVYEKYDLSSLNLITYGTEPMPQSTLDILCKIFPNTTLKQTYGLSEVGITGTKSEKSDSLFMKIGGEGVETKIIDDILYIKTKSVMLGYLNAPNPFDEDGWFCTKDKVEVREDGYMKILGRTTDIINVGGEKVYPNDVESVLLQFEGVKDVRVYGEENAFMGKVVAAEVSVEPQNNNKEFLKQLRIFCVKNLERYKIPVNFKLVEEDLFSARMKKRR